MEFPSVQKRQEACEKLVSQHGPQLGGMFMAYSGLLLALHAIQDEETSTVQEYFDDVMKGIQTVLTLPEETYKKLKGLLPKSLSGSPEVAAEAMMDYSKEVIDAFPRPEDAKARLASSIMLRALVMWGALTDGELSVRLKVVLGGKISSDIMTHLHSATEFSADVVNLIDKAFVEAFPERFMGITAMEISDGPDEGSTTDLENWQPPQGSVAH